MFQLQISHCKPEEAENLSLLLEETAALAVSLSDEQDVPILEPELGTTPLWPEVKVEVLFADKEALDSVHAHLLQQYPQLHYGIEELPEQDWERVCLTEFKPQQFGEKLWICPSWLTPPHPEAVNLILDPGLAFGTGTHPTTYLCLTWLEKTNLAGKSILDYGCGSGVLALAALKLGATQATAVDIDPQALIATQSNAEINHLPTTQLTVDYPERITEKVDLVIANILLTPLLALKTRFLELLNQQGLLVVSGILAEQVDSLIASYADVFKHQETQVYDGWAVVVFRRQDLPELSDIP